MVNIIRRMVNVIDKIINIITDDIIDVIVGLPIVFNKRNKICKMFKDYT